MNEKGFEFTDFSFYKTKEYDNGDSLIRIGVVNKEDTKIKFIDNGEVFDIPRDFISTKGWGGININDNWYDLNTFVGLKYFHSYTDKRIIKLENKINSYDGKKLTIGEVKQFEKKWNDRVRELHEKEEFMEF